MSVVWFISPEVSCTVDKPGEVEREHVPGHGRYEECVPVCLTEQIVRNDGRQIEADERSQRDIPPTLEANYRILEKVRAVNGLSFAEHLGVLFAHQPTYVSKEEASVHVVRIGMCLRVFVMHAMIAGPFVEVILK